MNERLAKIVIVSALVVAPASVSAYPAKLATRPFSQKQASDDLVVFDFVTSGNLGKVWSLTVNGQAYEYHIVPNGRGSIEFKMQNLVTPGIEGQLVVIKSLDRMFPKNWPAANTKWRVAFTANLFWVETSTSESGKFDNAPTYSTVAFFGVPEPVYQYYMNNGSTLSYDTYGKSSELMDDVKQNYAKWAGHPYALPQGASLYRADARSAIFKPFVVD